MTTNPMTDGRLPDTVRRRERLLTAISTAAAGSGEISVSRIARAAGVHRTFLYRHLDLLPLVHAAQPPRRHHARPTLAPRCRWRRCGRTWPMPVPVAAPPARTPVSSSSNALLAGLLGDQVWAEPGLGGGEDIQQLQCQITRLEEHLAELTPNSTNALKSSRPPGPPTASSWPSSTVHPAGINPRKTAVGRVAATCSSAICITSSTSPRTLQARCDGSPNT